jgi:hypothetical protein
VEEDQALSVIIQSQNFDFGEFAVLVGSVEEVVI